MHGDKMLTTTLTVGCMELYSAQNRPVFTHSPLEGRERWRLSLAAQVGDRHQIATPKTIDKILLPWSTYQHCARSTPRSSGPWGQNWSWQSECMRSMRKSHTTTGHCIHDLCQAKKCFTTFCKEGQLGFGARRQSETGWVGMINISPRGRTSWKWADGGRSGDPWDWQRDLLGCGGRESCH